MDKLIVSSSPHARTRVGTQGIMYDVILSLVPAAVAGIIIFGWRALLVIATCVASCLLSEFLYNLVAKKKNTLTDLSAVVTGLLLALNLRADVPLWQCVVGSAFAIVVVKCFFGGLGCNFANPAITARVFLLVSFTGTVAGGATPVIADVVSGATPLEVIASGSGELPDLADMLLGNYGGAIGETCTLALVVGFIYLVCRRVIHFETPVIFVLTVFIFTLIAYGSAEIALYEILSGGLMLGAIFMATDYVTTPITRLGRAVFALGCGLITSLIRVFGSYPEGVSFAILFMNILSPYIEKWTTKRPFGGKKA